MTQTKNEENDLAEIRNTPYILYKNTPTFCYPIINDYFFVVC